MRNKLMIANSHVFSFPVFRCPIRVNGSRCYFNSILYMVHDTKSRERSHQSNRPAPRSLLGAPRPAPGRAPPTGLPPNSEAIISCRGLPGARGSGMPKYAFPRVIHAWRREYDEPTDGQKDPKRKKIKHLLAQLSACIWWQSHLSHSLRR